MNRRNSIGLTWLAASMCAAAAMILANYFIGPEFTVDSNLGICLKSPNIWRLTTPVETILSVVLVVGAGPLLMFFNKRFNFIRGANLVMPSIYVLLTASNCYVTSYMSASPILMLVVVTSLWILFSINENTRNAAQAYFSLATLLSIGSMIQYAFLPMTIALALCGIVMKTLRFKETVAMILGLIAPYWVGVGLGLIPISGFHMPALNYTLMNLGNKTELFAMIIFTGVLCLIAALQCMNNAILLYAGNSRIRRMNNCLNIVGFTAILCMLSDYNNMMTYMSTLYFWIAVQAGNLFALHRIFRPSVVMAVIISLIVTFYFFLTWGF
ncbi:MAG: hypothetical protein NC328_06865 [Muribaculum sp.]|nr:hypothetical protein [Muribaculum sp.]